MRMPTSRGLQRKSIDPQSLDEKLWFCSPGISVRFGRCWFWLGEWCIISCLICDWTVTEVESSWVFGSWDSAVPQLKTSFLRRYPEYGLNLGCQSQMPCPICCHPWDQDRWPWIEHSTVAKLHGFELGLWNSFPYALLKTALRFHQLPDTSGLWTSTRTVFDFPSEWMERHCFSWTNPYMQDTVCAYCLISESRNNNGTGTLASTVDDIIIFFVAIFHDCWGQCTWQFVHALHVYTAIFFNH